MAEELLTQQDEVTELDETGMIIPVVDIGTGITSYILVKNFFAIDRFWLKRPGGGFVQIEATDDNADPLKITTIGALP